MDVIWIVFLFALGACVGSFLNVVIYRVPRGESIVFPGSHCPKCGRAIRWYDNLPILSWLLLRARCRHCKEPISARYVIIETVTACMVAGLYVLYYLVGVRDGAGSFDDTWWVFAAHAVLLVALLACSMVDVEHWIVPLEICWIAAGVGILLATAAPGAYFPGGEEAWLPAVSPNVGAMAIAATVGLAIAVVLQHYGVLQPSFLDADEKLPASKQKDDAPPRPTGRKRKKSKGKADKSKQRSQPTSVAITKAHGVNPRLEILREALFLAPAAGLAALAYILVSQVDAVSNVWARLTDMGPGAAWPGFARHFGGFQAALVGYLIGGLWIWGTRIVGTLLFNKEAMGLGDVHILAAVGAVNGWIVATATFFIAPLFGLLWALYLLARRNQRELPYGPWLAAAAAVVMVAHGALRSMLDMYIDVLAS